MVTANWVVKVRIAWWFRYLYLPGLELMLLLCWLMGYWWVEPNAGRVNAMLQRAVKVSGPVSRGVADDQSKN